MATDAQMDGGDKKRKKGFGDVIYKIQEVRSRLDRSAVDLANLKAKIQNHARSKSSDPTLTQQDAGQKLNELNPSGTEGSSNQIPVPFGKLRHRKKVLAKSVCDLNKFLESGGGEGDDTLERTLNNANGKSRNLRQEKEPRSGIPVYRREKRGESSASRRSKSVPAPSKMQPVTGSISSICDAIKTADSKQRQSRNSEAAALADKRRQWLRRRAYRIEGNSNDSSNTALTTSNEESSPTKRNQLSPANKGTYSSRQYVAVPSTKSHVTPRGTKEGTDTTARSADKKLSSADRKIKSPIRQGVAAPSIKSHGTPGGTKRTKGTRYSARSDATQEVSSSDREIRGASESQTCNTVPEDASTPTNSPRTDDNGRVLANCHVSSPLTEVLPLKEDVDHSTRTGRSRIPAPKARPKTRARSSGPPSFSKSTPTNRHERTRSASGQKTTSRSEGSRRVGQKQETSLSVVSPSQILASRPRRPLTANCRRMLSPGYSPSSGGNEASYSRQSANSTPRSSIVSTRRVFENESTPEKRTSPTKPPSGQKVSEFVAKFSARASSCKASPFPSARSDDVISNLNDVSDSDSCISGYEECIKRRDVTSTDDSSATSPNDVINISNDVTKTKTDVTNKVARYIQNINNNNAFPVKDDDTPRNGDDDVWSPWRWLNRDAGYEIYQTDNESELDKGAAEGNTRPDGGSTSGYHTDSASQMSRPSIFTDSESSLADEVAAPMIPDPNASGDFSSESRDVSDSDSAVSDCSFIEHPSFSPGRFDGQSKGAHFPKVAISNRSYPGVTKSGEAQILLPEAPHSASYLPFSTETTRSVQNVAHPFQESSKPTTSSRSVPGIFGPSIVPVRATESERASIQRPTSFRAVANVDKFPKQHVKIGVEEMTDTTVLSRSLPGVFELGDACNQSEGVGSASTAAEEDVKFLVNEMIDEAWSVAEEGQFFECSDDRPRPQCNVPPLDLRHLCDDTAERVRSDRPATKSHQHHRLVVSPGDLAKIRQKLQPVVEAACPAQSTPVQQTQKELRDRQEDKLDVTLEGAVWSMAKKLTRQFEVMCDRGKDVKGFIMEKSANLDLRRDLKFLFHEAMLLVKKFKRLSRDYSSVSGSLYDVIVLILYQIFYGITTVCVFLLLLSLAISEPDRDNLVRSSEFYLNDVISFARVGPPKCIV